MSFQRSISFSAGLAHTAERRMRMEVFKNLQNEDKESGNKNVEKTKQMPLQQSFWVLFGEGLRSTV